MRTKPTPLQNAAHTTFCRKRAGIGPADDRRIVCVGVLRKSGKGALHSRGLCRANQLLHSNSHSPAAWKAVMGLARSLPWRLPCRR